MVMAVSLDIKNAFNTLPWSVKTALSRKNFPQYLQSIIDAYLSDRSVEYIDREGVNVTRRMVAGVPQGSVLGPVLWNIGYDSVLQEGSVPGFRIECYADDILVLAAAEDVNTAVARANMQVGIVVNRIERLGLTVATHKTEAVCFPGRERLDRTLWLQVGNERMTVGRVMKYLGVMLDSRMSFRDHLGYVEQKVGAVTRVLDRLMPNLRGLGERKRRLYADVIRSVILYAAPV